MSCKLKSKLLGRCSGQKTKILPTICCFLCITQVGLRDASRKQHARTSPKNTFFYCAPVKLVWEIYADAVGNRTKVTFANCTADLDLRLWIPDKNWGVNFLPFFAMQDVLCGSRPPSNLSFMAPSLFLWGKFWMHGFPSTSRWTAGEGDRWAVLLGLRNPNLKTRSLFQLQRFISSSRPALSLKWMYFVHGKVSHEGVTSFSGSARVIWVGTSIHLNITARHSHFCFDNLATAECQCFDSSIRRFVKSFENLRATQISLLIEDF